MTADMIAHEKGPLYMEAYREATTRSERYAAVLTKRKEKKCSQCGKSKGTSKLKRCGQCHSAYYCSKECQTAHYPEHKVLCLQIHAAMPQQGGRGAPQHPQGAHNVPAPAPAQAAPTAKRTNVWQYALKERVEVLFYAGTDNEEWFQTVVEDRRNRKGACKYKVTWPEIGEISWHESCEVRSAK